MSGKNNFKYSNPYMDTSLAWLGVIYAWQIYNWSALLGELALTD
jgi:hypothetical protein